jgi:thioredoxin reductase (NADPH)
MNPKIYDIIIIGAGPCGLACAIEAQSEGLSYLVLEKGALTESIRKYPIAMQFFSTAENIEIGYVPFSTIQGRASRVEALQYYRKVSEFFRLNVQLYTAVSHILRIEEQNIIEVYSTQREIFLAKNVIFATGYFDCPRPLGVSGEGLPHVSKYYDEPFKYVHKKVIIAGGGNSAVECALDLYRHGVDVTMIVRKEDFKPTAKYWILPDLKNRIREGKIKVKFNAQIRRIERSKIWVKTQEKIEELIIPADFVLLLIGYTPDENLLRNSGIELQENLVPLFDPNTHETNVKGVYVAGTVVCGTHTEKIFIENGRFDGQKIIKAIISGNS